MDMHVLALVGGLIVVGYFAAAWFRHSRPVQLLNGKERISPTV
jgi:hypothetical protein